MIWIHAIAYLMDGLDPGAKGKVEGSPDEGYNVSVGRRRTTYEIDRNWSILKYLEQWEIFWDNLTWAQLRANRKANRRV